MSELHSSATGCCSCSQEANSKNEHNSTEDSTAIAQKIIPIAIAIALFISGLIFQETLHSTPYAIGEYAVFIPAYLISGWGVLTNAGKNITRGRIFDENFLMTVATLGAIAIHHLPEAVGVMLFYQIGEFFQEKAVTRSRRSIQSLLEIRPEIAHLQRNGQLETVDPETVEVGDLIVVKPGEKIPLDGEAIEGISQVDTSPLTGESVPRTIQAGKTVLAGTINQTGVLSIRVTKRFEESSIARILELVENARTKKAKTEKFITRFARIYTPIVVLASLLVALLPPLLFPSTTVEEWVYRALVVLVISCPCGLVVSIPLGYFGGVGGAAKRGILVKGSMFLDALTEIKTVIFDKTGTLTQGTFEVREVHPNGEWNREGLLKLAAHLESYSNHPIAVAIREAYSGAIARETIADYREIAGFGVKATIDGRDAIAGNERFLIREGIDDSVEEIEETAVHFAVDGVYAGYITIADELKSDAIAAIELLKQQQIERAIVLTGDRENVAAKVALALQVDEYYAELLPEDKVTILEKILARSPDGEKVAFVGDGINDSPAIARADLGIAMGALGSEAAIETADIVIMTDAPSKVAEAIAVGKKTQQIVWQNIGFALGIKGVFIALGAFGFASMWAAVFADVGVALLAILNATRVLR
ncbi:cadmium-translocating P-type ATPase [Oxynema sp. CENA135]|uniref:heavy metal translocating P-type ATPase n=1 Tax=Oxynema sp. CENA135 TaxID=984206 RepID=UPI00190E47A8|nr:heavy metal translocating P-type ATPase [Oxynema sp. CENA135]MBK4731406.1 cadmium-translocating P-type ATPase [Oxynema sp. CENA135]